MKMPDGLTGVNESIVSMKKIDTALQDGMAADILKIGEEVTFEAARICAVDKGNMRESLRYEKVDKFTVDVIAGGIVVNGVDVNYPQYVEFGTYKMDAQPFMRPAADTVCKQHGGTFYLQTFVNRALK